MKVRLVGCTHQEASIGTRERMAFGPDQVSKYLIDQRRGLQRVLATFACKKVSRNAPQLVVHQRCQLLERDVVPVRPVLEEAGDFVFIGHA